MIVKDLNTVLVGGVMMIDSHQETGAIRNAPYGLRNKVLLDLLGTCFFIRINIKIQI